jgi:ribosomal protein RSM22 (predicted rRNA methylase)
MQVPPEIREFIEARAEQVPWGELKQACAELSRQYRARGATAGVRLTPGAGVAAYLLMRLPATYAAAHSALSALQSHAPELRPATCLDLGAGPGSAALAAREVFPSLNRFSLVERLEAMREAAHELLPGASFPATEWTAAESLPEHDLVIAAYALGEVGEKLRQATLARAWRAARGALVVIEPGSPAGFAVIRQARQWLLEAGAHLAAPCPAEGPCPMPDNDWCHFAARLERGSLLRRMKEAKLGYEDEKFAYIAACREPATQRAAGRIVRRPEHAPGLVRLVLCDGARIREERISRRNPLFQAARRSAWGGAWPPGQGRIAEPDEGETPG